MLLAHQDCARACGGGGFSPGPEGRGEASRRSVDIYNWTRCIRFENYDSVERFERELWDGSVIRPRQPRELLYPSAEDEALERLEPGVPDPENPDHARVREAMNDLPKQDEEALRRRVADSHTLKEVGGWLGVSPSTAGERLERIKRDFRIRYVAGERLLTAEQVGKHLGVSARRVRALAAKVKPHVRERPQRWTERQVAEMKGIQAKG